MKNTVIAFIITTLLAFSPAMIQADIIVDLELENSVALRFEELNATVSIENDSEEPFVMYYDGQGVGPAFSFEVIRDGETSVPMINKEPVVKRIVLMPGEAEEITRDLSLWFNMGREARYTIKAEVERNGVVYSSPTRAVRVVAGMPLAEKTRSLPGQPGVRLTYTVRYWSRDQKEYAFLSVEDRVNHTNYGVFELGPLLRINRPKIKVDYKGNVTVMHRATPGCIVRSRFRCSEKGLTFLEQRFLAPSGKPFAPDKEEAE